MYLPYSNTNISLPLRIALALTSTWKVMAAWIGCFPVAVIITHLIFLLIFSPFTHTTFILDDPTPTTSSPDQPISEMTSAVTPSSTPPVDTTITATPYSTSSVVPPTPPPFCIGKADGNYPVGKCSTKYATCLNGIASYQVIDYNNYKDQSF